MADSRLVSTAIGVLKHEEDRDVFAWLKLARSLGKDFRSQSDRPCLTLDQVRAIGLLRHCKSNDISALLHQARTPST